MQTVSAVVSASAGGVPPGPAESVPADGVFPVAMKQAMSPSSGKPWPAGAGRALPVVSEAAPAVFTTQAASAVPGEPSRPAALVSATAVSSAALTEAGSQDDVPATAAVSYEVPTVTDGLLTETHATSVANALQDVSDGRAAAPELPAAGAAVHALQRGRATSREAVDSGLSARIDPPVGSARGDESKKPVDGRAAAAPLPPDGTPGAPVAPVVGMLPATPAPRARAAEATEKARESMTQRPAADRAYGLMALAPPPVLPGEWQPPAPPAPATADGVSPRANARPAAVVGTGAAPTAAVMASVGVAERMPSADPPRPSTGMDAGPVAAPALAPTTVGVPAPAPAPAPAATAQVPEFNLVATPGDAQFGPQLGERVLWLVREGMHEARLQLNPRELGPVEVRLSVGDGAAQVSFSAQHAGTAAAVQQSLPQLRDLLAQQGLHLGQAAVFHQPTGDGDAARQQGTSAQPGWHAGGGAGAEFDDASPVAPARLLGRGLVDAYA
ncbi:MAG: hypothetical protein Kow0073_15120 [Immundisolibacter sp.]